MTRGTISESIDHVQFVIRESARNGERLVELKERLMKRNSREEFRFQQIKTVSTKKTKE